MKTCSVKSVYHNLGPRLTPSDDVIDGSRRTTSHDPGELFKWYHRVPAGNLGRRELSQEF